MSGGILEKIVQHKHQELKCLKQNISLSQLKSAIQYRSPVRDLQFALQPGANALPAVIAEVKKASPSRGIIREDFYPVQIAKAYQKAGAAAISVLTDEEFFKGSAECLQQVRDAVTPPVLRKDFIVDEYQIYQTAALGADAVLLIMAILDKTQARDYLQLSHSLGLHALVEVHDEYELELAVSIGSKIIGINNRDLRTFETTLDTTRRLSRLLPPSSESFRPKLVSESGIFTNADLRELGEMGVDAVLVGEALMREKDVELALRRLMG